MRTVIIDVLDTLRYSNRQSSLQVRAFFPKQRHARGRLRSLAHGRDGIPRYLNRGARLGCGSGSPVNRAFRRYQAAGLPGVLGVYSD